MSNGRGRRGSAAMEFAIWLPIMTFMVSAVVDYGYYMTRRVSVARSAMEGARLGAAVYEPTAMAPGTDIQPKAKARAEDMMTSMGIPCAGSCVVATYCPDEAGSACGDPPFDAVEVDITYPFTPIFGIVPIPTEIHEVQLMAVENQRE
ncbi:MAG: TadE/TadG family type IV pilus assembly protein [Myxococcota bacterium]